MDKPINEPFGKSCVVDGKVWEFVEDMFKIYGAEPPPTKLRDEIVMAFEWAWWGLEIDKKMQKRNLDD